MVRLSEHFSYNKLIKAVIGPVLMMVFTSIYTIVDGLFVSNFVGETAFAGLNLIFPFTMIIGAIGFMFGAGGSALVGYKLGKGLKDEANRIFSGIVYFTIIVGAIVSIVCCFLVEEIALFLGATPEMLPHAVAYGRIIILGEVFFITQNLFQTFSMVAEKPHFGFITSVVAGVTNMFLDALFILVFKMGIEGAALATISAQCLCSLVGLIYFGRKNTSLLKLTTPNFNPKNILKAITNGSSEFLGNISSSIVGIVFNLQLLKYTGESGVIAYGILMYLGFVFNAIFIGYAIGTAPIISFNYGASNNAEVKNVLKKSVILSVSTGIIMTAIGLLFCKPLSNIFISNNETLLNFTINAMKIFAFSFIFSGLNIFTSSFFTALNNGLISAFVSMSRTLVFQIVAVLTLPLLFGVDGIWFSLIIAELLSLFLNAFFIALNKKKYKY